MSHVPRYDCACVRMTTHPGTYRCSLSVLFLLWDIKHVIPSLGSIVIMFELNVTKIEYEYRPYDMVATVTKKPTTNLYQS